MLIVFFNVAMDQTAGVVIGSVSLAILFMYLYALGLLAYVLVSSIRGLSKLDAGEAVF